MNRGLIFFLFQFFVLELISQADCPLAESPVTLVNPTIVGNGTPASCTQTALQNALNTGGDIRCNCGANPVTISITSQLIISGEVTLDGQGLVTLDGQNSSRILLIDTEEEVVVQNMHFRNGLAPSSPPSPYTHWSYECGGAIYTRGTGIFKAINCEFRNNSVVEINKHDVAGGAVYVFGKARGIFSNCTFENNTASNGGAIGGLGSDIIIANCYFEANGALGTSSWLAGHGGAINLDGVEITGTEKLYSVCGSTFINNHAYVQGGVSNTVFSDNQGTKLFFDQCYFEGNYLTKTDGGNGGAIFHYVDEGTSGTQELQFEIQRSSFFDNHCTNQGGAIWAGITGQGIIENCTFFRDSVHSTSSGLGGAVNVHTVAANQGGWIIKQNTFVENYAGLFAGGFFGGVNSVITWHNNILYNNSNSNINPWVGHNVNRTMNVELGANIQWPQYRPNGSEDNKVTNNVIFQNPMLILPPSNHGGPTMTIALQSSSPAIGIGTQGSAIDQRMATRSNPCDLGAFEYGAMAIPDSVHVTGVQSGSQTWDANVVITADATLQGFVDFLFRAGQRVILYPGFEVKSGVVFTVE